MKPKALIFSGYGFNSEDETKFGFELAGAVADIVHINDIIDKLYKLSDYQILAFPGGFSYGDDTGSGNAYAHRVKQHAWEAVKTFLTKDKLAIGICNGFQVMVNLGLVPAFEKKYGARQVALLQNESARLVTRWTDMKVEAKSPWLIGIETLSLPIAHGEGRLYADEKTLERLEKNGQVALRYVRGEICNFLDYPANPNGALHNIAGIIDPTGKVLGLMPHPERGMFFHQRPDWTMLSQQYKRAGRPLPEFSDGIKIFRNAVEYFK